MKKFFLFAGIILSCISIHAQSLDKTRWGDWGNEDSESSEQNIPAQKNIGSVLTPSTQMSSSNNLIIKAIETSVLIIKQQYRLEKDGSWWGKDNRDFFGETISLGIKVSGGMLFTGQVQYPWKYDSNFGDVDRSYKPYTYESFVKNFNTESFEKANLELGTSYVRTVGVLDNGKSTLEVFCHDDSRATFGLPIADKSELGETVSGYLVWVYNGNNMPRMEVQNYELNLNDDISTKLHINNSNSLLGGFLVTAAFQQGGRIQFQVAGVAVREPSTKEEWTLVTLMK